MATKSSRELYTCDRCGVDYLRSKLRKQRGLLVCSGCYDDWDPKPKYPDWGSARSDSTSVTPVNAHVVFSVSASGIASAAQSYTHERDGASRAFLMFVQGDGGAVTVTGNPAIGAGTDKDRLTLVGQSDTNTLTFTSGNGLSLSGGAAFTLGAEDTLQLSYDSGASVWRETSRSVY